MREIISEEKGDTFHSLTVLTKMGYDTYCLTCYIKFDDRETVRENWIVLNKENLKKVVEALN